MKTIKDILLLQTYANKHNLPNHLSFWEHLSKNLTLYKKGDYLYTCGSLLSNLIFVVQGHIKLSSNGKNGEYHHLTLYQEFALIGDVEYILECPATADVEALTDVYCIEIPLVSNKSHLDQDLVFQRYLNKHQAQKLMSIDTLDMQKEIYPVEARLASYLLASNYKEKDMIEDLKRISLQLHCSYRQLLRVFQKMTIDGIFAHSGSRGHYLIKNISALQALAIQTDTFQCPTIYGQIKG